MFALLTFLLCSSTTLASKTSLDTLKHTVQTVLNQQALLWNASFQAGFSSTEWGEFGVAAGLQDAASPTPTRMTPDTMVPVGSATKAYTAATVVQLVDQGMLALDDPMHRYVDPVLTRLNGTTLLDLWNGDTTINTVTIRHLLGMQSGLRDYDDGALQTFTHDSPSEDKTGVDMLHELDKSWLFPPGQGGAYSSVGFVLLGFVLVEASASTQGATWNDFDQRSFMSPDQHMRWNRTTFPKMGRCTNYDLPSQFALSTVGTTGIFYNLGESSCLNGWTCGNLAASAQNLAGFFRALIGEQKIVSAKGLYNMTQFQGLTTGFAPGLPYGLGLMSFYKTWPAVFPDFEWIGHAGQDYASGCPLCGFNVKYKFGVAVTTNSISGMNCSDVLNLRDQKQAQSTVSCHVHNAMVQFMSKGAATLLNCRGDTRVLEHPRKQQQRRRTIQQFIQEKDVVGAVGGLGSLGSLGSLGAVSAVGAAGTCEGKPFFGIPYIADGACHASTISSNGDFWYIAVLSTDMKMVNISMWYKDQAGASAKTCSGVTSFAPHGISPFSVPVDTCFRVPSGGSEIDLMFFYNGTWRVSSFFFLRAQCMLVDPQHTHSHFSSCSLGHSCHRSAVARQYYQDVCLARSRYT